MIRQPQAGDAAPEWPGEYGQRVEVVIMYYLPEDLPAHVYEAEHDEVAQAQPRHCCLLLTNLNTRNLRA